MAKPAARQVRIVGGQYRRTPLTVLDSPGLRPTPDRVRETLFNWLNHLWDGDFAQRRVLDLFAGTGALGLEAASRGAAHVVLVEAAAPVARALQATCARLRAEQVDIVVGDALGVLARRTGAPFDLVLLDPPFGGDWFDRLWPRLSAVLAPDALVYAENDTPITPPTDFVTVREARAGAVYYHLLRHEGGTAAG